MEINKLVDLNNLRTSPQLSISQRNKLLGELELNIFNADWITIGIMAPCDNRAIEALKSIGSLNPAEMAKPISDFVYEKMGIPIDRIYISFEDVPASLWAWNGRTFG